MVWSTLIISPILKGLNETIKKPPIRFASASWEATPAIIAIIPAPLKTVWAISLNDGKASIANNVPRK